MNIPNSQIKLYDIEYFEPKEAPQKKNEKKNNPSLKKVAPKTESELRAQEIHSLKKALHALGITIIISILIGLQIGANARNYQLDRQILQAEATLQIAEAENIRLSSALDSMTGIAVIETYATEILGMSKVESYQIECIDLTAGDEVIYTSSLLNNIKQDIMGTP